LIQGGCADVVKLAMNRLDEVLQDFKSQMIMQIHDELVFEVHHSEMDTVPQMAKDIMEAAYPHTYLPLTCGVEFSHKSLADKETL